MIEVMRANSRRKALDPAPQRTAAARQLAAVDWARVVATTGCLALAGAGALYFSTYAPKPLSAQEQATSRARSLANCGAGMFDVVPHDAHCPRFDAIALDSNEGGCMPACNAYTLTLHANGEAVLEVRAPEAERGRYEASISDYEFRELANVLASLDLGRRGHLVPAPPDVDAHELRGGCGGKWSFSANLGGAPGETEAVAQCLAAVRKRADWSLVVPEK
jgi:hypothetical protein